MPDLKESYTERQPERRRYTRSRSRSCTERQSERHRYIRSRSRSCTERQSERHRYIRSRSRTYTERLPERRRYTRSRLSNHEAVASAYNEVMSLGTTIGTTIGSLCLSFFDTVVSNTTRTLPRTITTARTATITNGACTGSMTTVTLNSSNRAIREDAHTRSDRDTREETKRIGLRRRANERRSKKRIAHALATAIVGTTSESRGDIIKRKIVEAICGIETGVFKRMFTGVDDSVGTGVVRNALTEALKTFMEGDAVPSTEDVKRVIMNTLRELRGSIDSTAGESSNSRRQQSSYFDMHYKKGPL